MACGDEIGAAEPLDRALDEELAAAVRRTGAATGCVFLYTDGRRELRLVAICGVPEALIAPWVRMPMSRSNPMCDAVREDHLVWVGCQGDMARLYPNVAAAFPYRYTLAALPLRGARGPWGALLLMWPAGHPATADRGERVGIEAAARRIARSLDHADRPPGIPARPRVVSLQPGEPRRPPYTAVDFVERLPEGGLTLDLDGRITFVTTTAAELLGRAAEDLLGTRPWESLPWLDNPVAEDRYRTAVISREPVRYTVLRPPDVWLDIKLYPDASGISLRVIRSDTGGSRRSDCRTMAAGPAAPWADTDRIGRLYELVHLAAALTEAVGVRDVVDLVADQVLPAFGAQGLWLSAAEGGRFKVIGHRGYPLSAVERFDGVSVEVIDNPAALVVASGIPHFFASPEEISVIYPEGPSIGGKKAWAFLPLIVSGRPVGCCIISYDEPHTFNADERAILTSLAGLIAQALDRARLYDAKKDLAHGLQQALLPHSLPRLAGLDVAARYLPATHGMEIGGDFYDVVRLDDTTAAAVIGDVQGHNVNAAALMGQVRTAVHAYAAAGASPDEVLAHADRILTDLGTDLFVSCLYAQLDLAGDEIALASAGHPRPLLCCRPGEPPTARPLEIEPGPLLGIGDAADFPVTMVPLLHGTTLVLYTDGLVEVPGVDIDQTTDALARRLSESAGLPLGALIDELISTRPTSRHTDDIAVLALRRT
ncbi:SpoIIE family protein phosphatase [Actinoallomurus soli]|uniref:SpoIIE family protein phosphatase n=1 Tax=Actinoallomurus soli TaxID=2952535 RepID=UPI002092F236|nr:SpoIIE family protein phosphatase [Actinoallomurus soli]MCO5972683.1 SpoIIE family protein phosphatase [Actinoallomurus soli]